MKKFLSAFLYLFFSLLFTIDALNAETTSSLHLVGFFRSTAQIKITELQLNADTTQVLFSTQNNSKYWEESQKFEFEGKNSKEMNLQIKKIGSTKHNTIYEIIITENKKINLENNPLFLKISAN